MAVVAETVAERNRLMHDPASVPRLALVAAIHGELAELMLEGAEAPVSIPIPDLELLDSAFVGAALALRFERFGRGQTLLKAAPAIKLDGGDDSRIYPYERPLPITDAPMALAARSARRRRCAVRAGSRSRDLAERWSFQRPRPGIWGRPTAACSLGCGAARAPGSRTMSRRSSGPGWLTITTGAGPYRSHDRRPRARRPRARRRRVARSGVRPGWWRGPGLDLTGVRGGQHRPFRARCSPRSSRSTMTAE